MRLGSSKILFIIFILLVVVTLAEVGYYAYYQIFTNKQLKQPLPTQPLTEKQTTETAANKNQLSSTGRCPKGFILVPGDPSYKTDDFCVMKYEAKCDINNDGIGDKGQQDMSFTGWDNAVDPCKGNGRVIVSSPKGWPIVRIPQSDTTGNSAKSYCKNQGWHLITNSEWMTIARNIEKNPDNWCMDNSGGKCGKNNGGIMLTRGHSQAADELIDGPLEASEYDNKACFSTVAKDSNNNCGDPQTEKRTHTISNGQIIWDFAGNVWEWEDMTVNEKDLPTAWNGKVIRPGGSWSDYSKVLNKTDWYLKDTGVFSYDDFGPLDKTLNSVNGIGRMFHNSNPGKLTQNIFGVIRGGGWPNGANSGIYAAALNREPTYYHTDLGFRCATNTK